MPRALAILIPILAAALAWRGGRDDTLVVMFLLFVPLAALGLGRSDRAVRKSIAIAAAIGLGAAFLFHFGMAQVLGGFIRPEELLWTAWFLTGCVTLMRVFDLALQKVVDRRIRVPVVKSLTRLAIVMVVLLPAMVAVMQVVRVKIGYTFPLAAQGAQAFTARAADGVPIRGYFIDRHAATTLIVVHGLGAHSENFLPYLTTAMGDRGINGLIFDLRGHGYSGGHVSSFGYHEQKDLDAVINWLKARPTPSGLEKRNPATHLVVYAFSMGSAGAILDAPRHPEIDGIIIDSGFARLNDVAWAVADRLPPGLRQAVYFGGLPIASLIAQAPLGSINPVEALAQIRVPVLVYHGGEDAIIPVAQGQALLDVPGVRGRIIPGGLHTNLPAVDGRYFAEVGEFIDTLLRLNEPIDPRPPITPRIGAPK